MKGDFSRDSYQPARNYSRVLMQQGRVQLDADWNEQVAILLGMMRTFTRDVFGPAAGPQAECGFELVTADTLASLPKAEAEEIRKFLKSENADLGKADFVIRPGRYYVHGLPVEAPALLRYRAQGGLSAEEQKEVDLLATDWFAYLDVWEEFVAPDQDPAMREVALGGLDTCARAAVRWRVRLIPGSDGEKTFKALTGLGSGTLRARANPSEKDDALCAIAPDARYRGPENQLYRVEIQAGGKADPKGVGASFKWSRDNGSVVFPVISGGDTTLTLAHLGRDALTTLTESDWVEYYDADFAAGPGVGILAQVTKVWRDDLRVELALPDGVIPPKRAPAADNHPLLRRWDHKGSPKQAGGALPVTEGKEMELEDGVMITFAQGGEYRPGEYWLIPARTETGDVEWPGSPDAPEFVPPAGPVHYYAPLAAHVGRSATGAPMFSDLRCQIARLPCAELKEPAVDKP